MNKFVMNPNVPSAEKMSGPEIMKGPQMQPVESSNIRAVGYTPGPGGKPGNLYAEFLSGTVYVYADVPANVWEALLDAPSKGGYLSKHIRGVFAYHKKD